MTSTKGIASNVIEENGNISILYCTTTKIVYKYYKSF